MRRALTPPFLSPRRARVVATVLALLLLGYAGLSIFGAVAIMQLPRLPVDGSPLSVGLNYEDISFSSRGDHITLKGWYIKGNGEKAIIVVHGGFQNRVDDVVGTLELARDLQRKGFDMLLFDLRGRGESEGQGRSLLNIGNDLGGAFDYVINRGLASASICIMGFCSGAASACIFASSNNVGGLVLDGCFPSVRTMIYNQAAQRHIPSLLLDIFYPGLQLSTFLLYGYRELAPVNVMSRVKAPIFFIHEEHDELITLADTQQLFERASDPASMLWEINGALHSEGYRSAPVEYVNRVSAFLHANLRP